MRGSEFNANQTTKRGLVVERDPARQKVRVRFGDEDDLVSNWLDVLASAGGSTKTFMMPDVGDEVWCALDAKGEDGCVLGVKYNAVNAPPFGSNDNIGLVWPGGSMSIDKDSGSIVITSDGPVKIVGSEIIPESATLTHNGKNIGDDHQHSDVVPGPEKTGGPV